MLKSLYIRNYVLIDKLDIRFENGFSVITGETGAGKSIILGALGLVLGQRADGKSIKNTADKCIIEAVFDISAYQLAAFFESHDLEYDPETCLLRRELYASGKSRAFVNDSPASLSVLKELGSRLIDIHSQHQNLLLGDNRFQLRVTDVIAENTPVLEEYQKIYHQYQFHKKALVQLQEKAVRTKQEEDYVCFQLEQLTDARLQPGEQEELEQELETLSHAEEIKGTLYKVNGLLNGDDMGAVRVLKEALMATDSLERYFPKAKEIADRLRSAYIDLNDLASETDILKEDIEFNPERMEWVSNRLDTLYSLQQKHRVSSLEELLALQDKFILQLQEIDSFDEQIAALEHQRDEAYRQLIKVATRLTERRKQAAHSLASRLAGMVAPLGIPNARLDVSIQPRIAPGTDGMDDIQFLFSANKNGIPQPVAQIASGGEISRLMLCIKAMIAGFTALPAIIFDEVDTGVSGDIADKMGEIMKQLGTQMQVLAITHLPQIASKGKAHYFVYKQDIDEQTVTRIRQLTAEERITEVARMLSGASLTDASVANAKDLLGMRN
ncbi:MAG: DNA repair protein RecN [Tannerellaceae bacterium]|nr:DNA repair protein RecN [Tannerellaceae bacterium]MCD8264140.1 DNA repair protein RecN [Tannerellaceae bacterium]